MESGMTRFCKFGPRWKEMFAFETDYWDPAFEMLLEC